MPAMTVPATGEGRIGEKCGLAHLTNTPVPVAVLVLVLVGVAVSAFVVVVDNRLGL